MADALASGLSLVLSEGEHDIEIQSPCRVGRVEGFRDRDKRCSISIENLEQLMKVGYRTGKSIKLVDDDDVDLVGRHIGKKALEGGSIQSAPGNTAVVVTVRQEYPSLPTLARNVCLTCLPLGVQRVEIHFKAFLAR